LYTASLASDGRNVDVLELSVFDTNPRVLFELQPKKPLPPDPKMIVFPRGIAGDGDMWFQNHL
jgi:hypothetical protein